MMMMTRSEAMVAGFAMLSQAERVAVLRAFVPVFESGLVGSLAAWVDRETALDDVDMPVPDALRVAYALRAWVEIDGMAR